MSPETEIAPSAPSGPGALDAATDLLQRVATGDQRAFSELHDLITPRMLGLVRHVLKDHAQSEEVVQEVLLEMWNTAPRFDPKKGKAVTWMLTMAHRRAIDRVRSAQSSRDRDTKIGIRDLGRDYDSVAENVEIRIEHERVEKALMKLTELQRQADEECADTRAALGLAVPPVTPSASMKGAVMARIAETPQVAPRPTIAPAEVPAGPAEKRANTRWFHRPGSVVLAAAAAVALFFGGVVAADVINPGAADAQQLAAIVAAPDVQTISSPVEGGASATLVSSQSLGVSAMVFEGLPELTDEQAYALWYITDGEPVAAGLFSVTGNGAGEDGTIVQVLEGTFQAGTVVGVTVEPSEGSPAPTTTPIVAIASA